MKSTPCLHSGDRSMVGQDKKLFPAKGDQGGVSWLLWGMEGIYNKRMSWGVYKD